MIKRIDKSIYWQEIRGICILSVVMIHSFIGFDYSGSPHLEMVWIIMRQILNHAVAVFIFLSGYFVDSNYIASEQFNYFSWLKKRGGGRLVIPFVFWSVFYSVISIISNMVVGRKIDLIRIFYYFVVGKAATPFYYIIVLVQLTLITPWLVRIAKKDSFSSRILWLVTPVYLVYLYLWNFSHGSQPPLYATLFPAWFGFYYFGIQVSKNKNIVIKQCSMLINVKTITIVLALSCCEAFLLRECGLQSNFYVSQVRIGSFLYAFLIICWLITKSKTKHKANLLSKVGDCSFGIFFIHMFVLMVTGIGIDFIGLQNCWLAYWGIRFIFTTVGSYIIVRIVYTVLQRIECDRILLWIGFK